MKFIVKIDNIFSNYLEIEADDELSAVDKAYDFFENNKDYIRKLKDYYFGTMPKEHWHAILKEEFEAIQQDVDKHNKVKESVAYLIHRAEILDRRNQIKRKNSIVGQLENFLLKKQLLKVDAEISEKNIRLTDEYKAEIKKLITKDNPLLKESLLEYLDPNIKPYSNDTLEEEAKLREITGGSVETKLIENDNVKTITPIEDRKNYLLDDKGNDIFEINEQK